jgi:hypothetical protein
MSRTVSCHGGVIRENVRGVICFTLHRLKPYLDPLCPWVYNEIAQEIQGVPEIQCARSEPSPIITPGRWAGANSSGGAESHFFVGVTPVPLAALRGGYGGGVQSNNQLELKLEDHFVASVGSAEDVVGCGVADGATCGEIDQIAGELGALAVEVIVGAQRDGIGC